MKQICCSEFFTINGNDLLYEKNAEKRATFYRPKTMLKTGAEVPILQGFGSFLYSLLQTGLYLTISIVKN
jgi:hypothetical protein